MTSRSSSDFDVWRRSKSRLFDVWCRSPVKITPSRLFDVWCRTKSRLWSSRRKLLICKLHYKLKDFQNRDFDQHQVGAAPWSHCWFYGYMRLQLCKCDKECLSAAKRSPKWTDLFRIFVQPTSIFHLFRSLTFHHCHGFHGFESFTNVTDLNFWGNWGYKDRSQPRRNHRWY